MSFGQVRLPYPNIKSRKKSSNPNRVQRKLSRRAVYVTGSYWIWLKSRQGAGIVDTPFFALSAPGDRSSPLLCAEASKGAMTGEGAHRVCPLLC